MQKAIDISIEGHLASMKSRQARHDRIREIAVMEWNGTQAPGAEDVGYPSIVGSEYNACILHYVSNRKTTENKDLVIRRLRRGISKLHRRYHAHFSGLQWQIHR